jgi:exosortase
VIAVAATLGASLTLSRAACLVSLTGCIWSVWGTAAIRFAAFPLALLLFTFPIPSPVHDRLTIPLQEISIRGAQAAFHLLHLPVVRIENLLYLPSQIVVISQDCSGIQTLITLMFFCFVYSYWNERGILPRIVLTAAAIPASILMNIVRIAATGLLGEVNHKYAVGTWHAALGYAAFVLGFTLVWGIHSLITRGLQQQAVEN